MKSWKLKALSAFVAVIVLLVLYVWSALSPPTGPKALTGPMTFDNVTLVTPARSRIEAAAIAMQDGHIAAVGKQGTVRVGSVRDDYAGMYVLPGLVTRALRLRPDRSNALVEDEGHVLPERGPSFPTLRDLHTFWSWVGRFAWHDTGSDDGPKENVV